MRIFYLLGAILGGAAVVYKYTQPDVIKDKHRRSVIHQANKVHDYINKKWNKARNNVRSHLHTEGPQPA